jgi:hypothetical protein
MPHMPLWHSPLPHVPFPHSPIGSEWLPLPPWAANVEYWVVRCPWPHEGHFTESASALRRTSFSNLVPQSSQAYSKIGMILNYQDSAWSSRQGVTSAPGDPELRYRYATQRFLEERSFDHCWRGSNACTRLHAAGLRLFPIRHGKAD